jgi:hypothetical protein
MMVSTPRETRTRRSGSHAAHSDTERQSQCYARATPPVRGASKMRRVQLTQLRPALLVPLLVTIACSDDQFADSTTFTSFTTLGDGDADTTNDAESSDSTGDGDGDPGDGDGDSGDGDGDSGDGDGDGDSGDGDGDGDSGDGDGDSGDGDSGDGDGDSGDGDTGAPCVECTVTLDSTQSSSFVALPGTEYLGSATLQGDQIIYALDEVGTGRVVYTADTNLLYNEITDCPLWEWLGQTGDQLPKVLSFGRNLCGGLGNNLAAYPDLTYAGTNLPAQYVDNPALLAAEYDAVIYCTVASTPASQAQTIVDYVQDHGGGLYLASEYWGFINQGDLTAVNAIAVPFGTEFQGTNLAWGQANGEVGFACFPEPQ